MGRDIQEEYVPTNGIETYVLHLPQEGAKTVLLYVHGGPGESAVPFMWFFKRNFGPVCSLVTYDQRGTGRTCRKNPEAKPDLALLLEDLHEVISHLKRRYGVEKVALLGHSWGSGLGSVYALKHPEDLLCYIGVGQLVNGRANEATGAKRLRELILAANNKKDLAALDAVGEYPCGENDPFSWDKIMRVRKLQRKYGLAVRFGATFFREMLASPTLKFSDVLLMKKTFAFNYPMVEWVITSFSLEAYPKRYETPVFYLLGERDYQTPYVLASAYFDAIEAPQKELVLLKNAGHFPQLDDMPSFGAALQRMLSKAE